MSRALRAGTQLLLGPRTAGTPRSKGGAPGHKVLPEAQAPPKRRRLSLREGQEEAPVPSLEP